MIIKKPFATLRGKLAQYYFEIITLPVHICTFILALQTRRSELSASLNETLCTCIIYLNTALITGTTGFMFIEIYKTISQWLKSQRDNAVHPITEEGPKPAPAKKFSNAATNTDKTFNLTAQEIRKLKLKGSISCLGLIRAKIYRFLESLYKILKSKILLFQILIQAIELFLSKNPKQHPLLLGEGFLLLQTHRKINQCSLLMLKKLKLRNYKSSMRLIFLFALIIFYFDFSCFKYMSSFF